MKKILLMLSMIISSYTFAYVNMYPVKFEKDITHGAYEDFTLYNRTPKIRKYRVYIEDSGDRNSMYEWADVYPKSITLRPLEEKSMKLYIEAPKGTKAGEYRANLIVKEVSLPPMKQEKEEREKKHKVLTMIRLKLKGIVKND